MVDIVVAVIVGVILIVAILYIRNEKKKGIQCIGCPNADQCSNKRNCNQSLYDEYKNRS